jgi:hypothetical protein
MKKIVLLLVLVSSSLLAQEKYTTVVVPKQFMFQKEANQYGLNDLCKLFFEKEGFQVLQETDVMTDEIFNNRCEYLYVDLIKDKGFLTTKMTVELKDCKKNVVLKGTESVTKEKNFDKAHSEVTRETLVSLRGKLNISKSIQEKEVSNKTEAKNEVIVIKEEIKQSTNATELSSSNNEGLSLEITKNGYNLIDENKDTKFELLKTSNPTIFIAKKGTFQGIFTLNGQISKFEYYQNNELIVEKVEVKF